MGAPPNLERIERKIRAENFRWNGPYNFLPKIQAGNYSLIPELEGAQNPDQLWNKALDFIASKMYVKQALGATALIRELNRLSLQDPPTLLKFIMEMQNVIVKTEAQGEALATTAMKRAEELLLEGLEELRKRKIPYGATLQKHFSQIAAPISQELSIPVMAEVGAMEALASSKRKGSPKTPGSKKTTEGQVAIRDCSNWEGALNDKRGFCLCLTGFAQNKLREYAGWTDSYSVATQKQLREWLPEVTNWKMKTVNLYHLRGHERGERVDFTPDKKKNSYTIRFSGEDCDKQFQSGSSTPPTTPPASPSPEAPSAPPTEGTKKSFLDYLNFNFIIQW